jgi:hypothetical protein
MRLQTLAALSLAVPALGACSAGSIAREPGVLPLMPVFGPIVGGDVIGGRVNEGNDVWLLVGGKDLVHLDLPSRRNRRVALKIAAGENCWGLARLEDGSLWTIKGRQSLIRIDPDGGVVREEVLPEPHLGLSAARDRLVYQVAGFTPPGPALRAGRPGDATTVRWSDMTTRTFDGIARASAVVLNVVSCGGTARKERPCWFPDEAAVSLIDAAGATRRLDLPGLDVVPPEVLLTAENPARPVRDAFLDRDGGLWVLSTGTAPSGGSERPGGWILARYGPGGEPLGVRRLGEPARLILRAEPGRALLLTGAGMVAEVIP